MHTNYTKYIDCTGCVGNTALDMGIKTFSKTFDASREIKLKDLSGKRLAIDAMTEIYRSALGAKSVKCLTDRYGNPTLHINVILANIIEMQRNKIDMIWVFDHDHDTDETKSAEFHNPAKINELLKRKKRKDNIKDELNSLRNKCKSKVQDDDEYLFSSHDDTDTEEKTNNRINQLEKQEFSITQAMINDIKLILNCLNIKYVEAPSGFEGEQIAANMAEYDIVDGVYSGDTDPIPFGSPILYKRNRNKTISEYTQADIIDQIIDNADIDNADIDDIIKICVVLGSDFAEKTKGIGPKTVMRKFVNIELSDDQRAAFDLFKTKCNQSDIVIHNEAVVPFNKCASDTLLDWLVDERSFAKKRIETWFKKVM